MYDAGVPLSPNPIAMRQLSPSHPLTIAALLGLSIAAIAHEDDPKILDVKPAVTSPGYRAGDWGRGYGFKVGAIATEEFEAENVTLLSWMPAGDFGANKGNDCWGYTSPSGREYALFGNNEGTSVVEVTVPSTPVILGSIDGPISLWRDIKTYGSRAYAVSEGGSGIQVISLANVDAGQVTLTNTVTTGGTHSSHNVAIDTDSGFLYRCGGSNEGLRFYDLASPDSPQLVGEWSDRYVHDAQIKTFTSGPYVGRQIAFCFSGFNGGFIETGLSIVDVTDKSNPVHRGQISWPNAGYSHQGWLSEDGQTLFVDDEGDEGGQGIPTTTYVMDVADIDNPAYLGSFTNGNSAIGHNLYTKGNLLYEANYRSGMRIFDVTNPLSAFETAWFDTDPDSDAASFNGLWSVYPYFPSGLVIGSDLERGLFMLWVGTPLVDMSIVGGVPDVLDPSGHTFDVTLAELNPGDYVVGTGKLHYDAGAGPVTIPLSDLGGGNFSVDVEALPCSTRVSYYFSAESSNGVTWIEPPNGAVYEATAATALPVLLTEAFETIGGWTVGAPDDTATAGLWVMGDPIGTNAQAEDDHTEAGLQCFFTGQGVLGGFLDEADVDNGKTTLFSPTYDLSGVVDPRVSYWRWYSNEKGINPPGDVFIVDVSNDGGATWEHAEILGPLGKGTEGGWFHHEFNVADFVVPTAAVQVRFIARDLGIPNTIEAGIDDFAIIGVECPDCNGNGTPDDVDIASGSSLDLDGEGTPDECQPLSADTGSLSTASGGTASFTLKGGALHASEFYWLLGSLSGTDPGSDIGSVHVPLVPDLYYVYTISHANVVPLVMTFATLDSSGDGVAQFQLAPGFTSLVGLTAHHAWIALDPGTLGVTFASNAMPLDFIF